MYLTVNQHDRLRTIIMNFEIPFRSYISTLLIKKYSSLSDFHTAVLSIPVPANASQLLKSEIGKIKSKPELIYNQMDMTIISMKNKIVTNDIDVPNVAALVALTCFFSCEFKDLINCFSDYDTYYIQLEKYHYVRNKLEHPGCKTLEYQDMTITLNFVSDVCTYIGIFNMDCFWDKMEDEIYKEIKALETLRIRMPVTVNNFDEMPLLDRRIVGRDSEIVKIKEFIYGIPGALRKKSSLCIYGYGGLGKTALVTETIKSIIKDVLDDTTINSYIPEFILFFTAKEEFIDISLTSGNIQKKTYKQNFISCKDLENKIYKKLEIKSFDNFHKKGIIVVDNLETLSNIERDNVKTFIESMSPNEIQYIITSRNEEAYEARMKIDGFEEDNGRLFIEEYILENELELELENRDIQLLLDISKGNTLVLVLCLRRLSRKLATVEGLITDLSQMSSVKGMQSEFGQLPSNGYEIISEFMFKNTFIEIEKVFIKQKDFLVSLLKIFAVYPHENIDIFTICMLMKSDYNKIEPYITILCRYLILERKGETYSLNNFAEKYIVQRFLPDTETYEKLSMQIILSMKEINDELQQLDSDLQTNSKVQKILEDWAIEYDGDRIAAAKAYRLYQDVNVDCQKGTKFFVENAYDDAIGKLKLIEKTTMHPYVKYQKARILKLIDKTCQIKDIKKEINKTFIDCIWTIKTNTIYTKIKSTKTYASILWIYGNFLYDEDNIKDAIRYLEESSNNFETLGIMDKDYYQCLTLLGSAYLDNFKITKEKAYFDRSLGISDKLFKDKDKYASDLNTKGYATNLRNTLFRIKKECNY